MSAGYHRLGANVRGKLDGYNNRLIGGGLMQASAVAAPVATAPPASKVGPAQAETELVPEPRPTAPPIGKSVARSMGYTGDSCSNCQSMKMKISGHCMVCEDCGTTTGCS